MNDTSASPEPTGDKPPATTNDQVSDAVQQVHDMLAGFQKPFAAGAAYQAISHALVLALHNAVAQQQHSCALRNALTTAAATALLDGRTAQAEAVLKLAESSLLNPSLDFQIGQLQNAIRQLREEMERTLAAAAAPEPPAAA